MKRCYRILAIVEGHGEQTAVPLLLRRWFKHRRYLNFDTNDLAIRAPGSGALKCPHDAEQDLGIEYYVTLAAADQPDGILVVLDADDDCIKRSAQGRKSLGPELRDRALAVVKHIPIEVVIANREFETWILAAADALEREGAIPSGFRNRAPCNGYESIAGCKSRMRDLLQRKYSESVDQTALTHFLPFSKQMAVRSRSFRKLMKALETLTRAARSRPPPSTRHF
jgi:hypothetical protein